MRIIQVTPRYFPTIGGIEAVVQKVSELLVKKGNDVTVYSIDKHNGLASNEIINGVTVKRFTPLFDDPLYIPEPTFTISLRKEQAEIVHVHNIHTFPPLIAALSKPKNSKMVLQPHYHRYGQTPLRHSLFQLYQKAFYGKLFSKTNLTIANSLYEKHVLQKDFPKLRNVVLLPEGLDTTETRKIRNIPVFPKRILFIGVLKRYKNVNRLFQGFSYLVHNSETNYRLVIVGDGPERTTLANLASSLGIEQLIEWKHSLSREDLLNEYAKASVFVTLSSLESFSRVVYDALFIGVPVVVNNLGALSHLVSDGFAEGVTSFKPQAIAEALTNASQKTYLKLTPDSKNFLDWKNYSEKLTDLYQGLQAINQ